MKKLILALLLVPFIGISQTLKPAKVVHSTRVFPKMGKAAAFEKALATHVSKFHTTQWKWRVLAIETGPDAGGYHIVEGPSSWDEFDKRGDLGEAHGQDWANNIAPLLQERTSSSYGVYNDELSTTPVSSYTDKIAITHLSYNPGYSAETEAMLKTLKPVWEATARTTAVYEVSGSGDPGYTIVARYKDGLKERDPGYKANFKENYEKINGAGSWQTYQDMVKKAIKHSWSEILSVKKSLSTQ